MDDEVSALIFQLADPQYSARKIAAKKLERLGMAAAPALREALSNPNPIVAIHVARLLGAIGDMESVPILTRRLYSSDTEVLQAVTGALDALAQRQASDEAIERIRTAQDTARRWRSGFISSDDERAWKPSPPTAASNEPPSPTSANQARLRATAGLPSGIEALIALLGHPDYGRRNAATRALAERGDEAVPALCEALSSRSPVVRQRAAEALGGNRAQASLAPLADLLRREGESLSPETNVTDAVRSALAGLAPHLRHWPLTVAEAVALVRLHAVMTYVAVPTGFPVIGAERLVALAAERPGPELRAALAYLKGRWPLVPREFLEARRAIEEATRAWADLPIAADRSESAATDLPRPAEPQKTERDLPRPSEEPR